MRRILPTILALLIGKDRYFPVPEWSSKSWTFNVFRAVEQLFGREYGVRCAMSAVEYEGKWYFRAHTLEASISLIETMIRGNMPKLGYVEIYVPALAFAGVPMPEPIRIPGIMFAIAYDNAAVPGTSSVSFTCTGSDRFMIAGFGSGSSGSGMAITYNSVSLTQTTGSPLTLPAFSDKFSSFYLTAPASGSNTLAYSGTSQAGREVASYTGVNQTGQPEAQTGTTQNSGSPVTCPVTVATTGAWVIGHGYGNTALTASTGTTARAGDATSGIVADSNGAPGTGTQNLVFTKNATAGQDCAVMVMSIAPVAASGPANLKSLDGNLKANIKSYNGNVLANIKSISGNS